MSDWGVPCRCVVWPGLSLHDPKGLFSNQLPPEQSALRLRHADDLRRHLYPVGRRGGMNIRVVASFLCPTSRRSLRPTTTCSATRCSMRYDPYTQMGVVATIKLDKQWTVQIGLTGGNDTAVWDPDAEAFADGLRPVDFRQQLQNSRSTAAPRPSTARKAMPTTTSTNSSPPGPPLRPELQHADRVLVHVGEERAGMRQRWVTRRAASPCRFRLCADSRRHPGMGDRELYELPVLAEGFDLAAQRIHERHQRSANRHGDALLRHINLNWTHFFKQNVFIRPEMVYYTALDNPAFQQGTKFTQARGGVRGSHPLLEIPMPFL